MKISVLSLIVVTICFGGVGLVSSLCFRANTNVSSSFRIVQVADLHLGEDEDGTWGPEQDHKSIRALHTFLTLERPDLVVLSGDQVTGENIYPANNGNNATRRIAYYRQIIHLLKQFKIPWATIMGNHDDNPYRPEDARSSDPSFPVRLRFETSNNVRQRLMKWDASQTLSQSKMGPTNITGVSNYELPILVSPMDRRVVLLLLFVDSGGGSLREAIDPSQVEWAKRVIDRIPSVPVFVFQHIPIHAFASAASSWMQHNCQGMKDDGISSVVTDSGWTDMLRQTRRVRFMSVGHDHGNDFCCSNVPPMHLCFARHSGYGGYGTWARGVRVYELQYNNNTGDVSWRSWVRMESGEIVHRYDPLEAQTRADK